MHQVTITIGRGAGAEQAPLSDPEWDAFRRVIQCRLAGDGWDLVVENSGTGHYEGVTEENHVFVGIREHAQDLDDEISFRAYLAATGRRYGQQTIALALGHSSLVECAVTA